MKPTNPYLATELQYFVHTFKRQPLLLTKAKGPYVWDEHGKKYLDFFSGLAVCGIGHNNTRVVKAIQNQTRRILHSSNYFYTAPQLKLARELTKRYAGSKVFFSNSGAEANEFAIKCARLWATRHQKPGRDIITFQNAFHGRTLATSAASQGKNRTHSYFAPLPKGFKAVPFNDGAALQKAVDRNTIAIMMEPVQGEGGIHIATLEFLKGAAALCKKHHLLFILDEIQSGMGRTGTFFAFEPYGVTPDIVTLAKGLAGGLPLAATLVKPGVNKLVSPGMHGSTFGGNPVACAASLEVLKLLAPKALSSIKSSGDYLRRRLTEFEYYPAVKTIRSLGLMVGIELNEPGETYVSLARERGLLINCTQTTVLRFLPPYFLTRTQMDWSLAVLHTVFKKLNS